MIRYLLLLIFILLVILASKALRATRRRDRDVSEQQRRRRASAPPDGTIMLACAHCGLHLPRDDALPGKGGVYCSEAHRALAEALNGKP